MVEIKNREDLEAWLTTRPREDAVLIAARAAARVLPLTGAKTPRHPRDGARLLSLFRGLALANLAGISPMSQKGAASSEDYADKAEKAKVQADYADAAIHFAAAAVYCDGPRPTRSRSRRSIGRSARFSSP